MRDTDKYLDAVLSSKRNRLPNFIKIGLKEVDWKLIPKFHIRRQFLVPGIWSWWGRALEIFACYILCKLCNVFQKNRSNGISQKSIERFDLGKQVLVLFLPWSLLLMKWVLENSCVLHYHGQWTCTPKKTKQPKKKKKKTILPLKFASKKALL